MRSRTHVPAMAFLPALLFFGAPAFGQAIDSGDTAWLSTATALVLFMTIPGLAMFYGGLVRSNNIVSVLFQCFAITCIVSVLWLLVGYSLAFGNSLIVVGDFSKVMFSGVTPDANWGTIPEATYAMFQLTFAIITPALIVGAFVERMRFSATLLFTGLWSLLVYSPLAHWAWGGGWLGNLGLMDFAGGTVVHVSAGTAAIVAAVVLGPRDGFPEETAPPHSIAFTIVGASMLWVGWYGFNGGSAIAANGSAGMAIATTHIAAATAALTWMVLGWIRNGKPSALGTVTGMVAGLGAITPASGFVGPGGALVIGLLSGLCCFVATNYLKRKLRIDDSLDVFPVHCVGGGLGVLLTAVFASKSLGIWGGQYEIAIPFQLVVQAVGVISTVVYTGAVTWVILKVVDALVGNRVTKEQEKTGLDLVSHDERGYMLDSGK